MIKVLQTPLEILIERITSSYDINDVIYMLNLTESDVISKILEEHVEELDRFSDVTTEMDYEEDGEEKECSN